MTIICVFGTSTTYGAWDFKKGGWVNRLRAHIDKSNAYDTDIIYNLGISGNTSTDLLERFDIECTARASEAILYKEPLVILFSVGINDAAILDGAPNVTKENYKANIKRLIEKARKYTDKIFFLEIERMVDESKTTPVPWYKTLFYYNKDLIEYNSILLDLCKNERIKVIRNKESKAEDLLFDGLHPNSKGHELIYKTVKDFLVKEKIIP